jgi:hypothetical protein
LLPPAWNAMPLGSVALYGRPGVLAVVRTATLLQQIKAHLGQHPFTSCTTAASADSVLAESSPAIIVFETGVWDRFESGRLVAMLGKACDSTVFVFWRPGAAAMAELVEVARAARHVYPIHENYSLAPLDQRCMERPRSPSTLEKIRTKLAGAGHSQDFNSC